MKASELITRLQQLIAEHGDLEVSLSDRDNYMETFFPVARVDIEPPSTCAIRIKGEVPGVSIALHTDHG